MVALLITILGAHGSAAGAGPAEVIRRGPAATRVVALTFDDGWHAGRCGEIFDTLVRFDVPATWFPNAAYVNRSPGLWRRIARRFPIANHTTHHRSLPTLSTREMRKEITSNERRLEAVTGRPMSKILRPPYGAYDRRVLRVAGQLGYDTVALWDVSAADTSRGATDRSVARAALRGRPGSVILMHCGPEVTPRVLPIIIARYACAGFRFATLEGLLAGDEGVEATVSCPPPPLPLGDSATVAKRTTKPARERGASAEENGREWRLTEAASGDSLEPVPPDALLTLRLGPRTASGLVGCDPYSAPVKRGKDGALSFGRVVRGTEGCGEQGAGDPAGYLELLAASVALRVDDGVLTLLDAEGRERLRFRTTGPLGVIGEWLVTAIADAEGILAEPATERQPTAAFGPTGVLRGSTGCNTYVGGYTTRGDALLAGPLLTGPASCGEDGDALEARFLAAMRSVERWQLRDRTLELRDAAESIVMELVPRVPEP
jgi:peptidoglycan/xylan/chitin deacetylase (PgdA/CDA1 family)/heat shock protein HslJ